MDLAASELLDRAPTRRQENGQEAAVMSVETDFGNIEIQISTPLVRLVKNLQASLSDDVAHEALRKADFELNAWREAQMPQKEAQEQVVLSFGVRLLLPKEFLKA
jgi:hypothetical protein